MRIHMKSLRLLKVLLSCAETDKSDKGRSGPAGRSGQTRSLRKEKCHPQLSDGFGDELWKNPKCPSGYASKFRLLMNSTRRFITNPFGSTNSERSLMVRRASKRTCIPEISDPLWKCVAMAQHQTMRPVSGTTARSLTTSSVSFQMRI
jgi:hypothetical protein